MHLSTINTSINYNNDCHKDDSKIYDNRTGAGVLLYNGQNDTAEEAIHLSTNVSHLIFAETKNKSGCPRSEKLETLFRDNR